ncbi:MAG: EAL domain-containing protein [Gammaproteobacteria bacterium]|jgi:diguanylate cyclase (GGDEF)-like protein/PAS domain S-box-containing protein
MMLSELRRIRRRFTALIITGLLLAPLAGLASALLFGLIGAADLEHPRTPAILTGYVGVSAFWAFIYFSSYFNPLSDWAGRHAGSALPVRQQRRLARFSRDYWGFFLLYAIATPALLFIATGKPIAGALGQFLQLVLLQLSVATLVGLPTYQLAQDLLGRLAGHFSLQKIQVSLKSKVMLLGGFVPLLCYSMLMNYHWQQTGSLTPGHMAIWLTLVAITGLVTLFSIRSITQALAPVQAVFRRSGASRHAELARLSPQSTDEIGFMTQALGKLFRRLGEQETHMRAVVDNAAEGIIVVGAKGRVEAFNPAAEKLFGYLAAEIRRQPLQWLVPGLFDEHNRLHARHGECEVEGYHRNGTPMQLSVRVSEIHANGQRRFTCLVADITGRKATEEQLRDAESRYRDLVETAHDLVWTMDDTGRLTYVNRACLAIYGLEPVGMLNRGLAEFRSPDHPPHDQEAIDALLSGKERVQFETVHLDTEGRPHFLSFSAKTHRDAGGRLIQISGTARDITEQKAFQHQLSYHAEHDSLTGLFNRNYFQQELERTVARVARNSSGCALFFIDLDQFKYINDTLGHAAGDRLLVDVASLLSSHVREGDLLARFGGDEFTLLLYNIERHDVLGTAEKFRTLCDDYKFVTEDKTFNISLSIGVAMIDNQVSSAEEALSHADLACNLAKQQGRNRTHLYNPAESDKAGMAADMGWAARVREMLEHDRFQLVYQPIVSVTSGRVKDYEVLVRMICDDGQLILPGGFMPSAERFGLIHSVDRWIVERAIRQLGSLHEQGRETGFSINLSGKAFEDASLLPLIQDMLAETGLDPTWLTFEITETAAIANLAAAEDFIGALKDIGCQFALDDFGSGFSSFAYLKHLPVDKLKIDGGFVKGMAHSSVDQAMVESMNQIAHTIGKQTVAECVENEATLQILKRMGVDRAQGNFIGRPREALMSIAKVTVQAGVAVQSH